MSIPMPPAIPPPGRWDSGAWPAFCQGPSELEGSSADVLDGRLKGDSLADRDGLRGVQGLDARRLHLGQTVEKCDRPVFDQRDVIRRAFFTAYNEAAEVTSRGRNGVALWSPAIRRLKG